MMKKDICAAKARKEVRQGLVYGLVSLAAGVFFTAITGVFSGSLWEIIANSGKNLVFIAVILFLLLGGAYLLLHGLHGLFQPESTDICKAVRSQLRPEEAGLPAREMLALADQDLACAQPFAGGKLLIGREWLCVTVSMGQPVVRLENLRKIGRRGKDSTGIYLHFIDHHGRGPISGELTPIEAASVELYLRPRAPGLKA